MYLHCCLYGVLYDMFDVTLYSASIYIIVPLRRSGTMYVAELKRLGYPYLLALLRLLLWAVRQARAV